MAGIIRSQHEVASLFKFMRALRLKYEMSFFNSSMKTGVVASCPTSQRFVTLHIWAETVQFYLVAPYRNNRRVQSGIETPACVSG
jgi:hypothetical protein